MDNQFKEIKDKIDVENKYLSIDKVPIKVYRRFKEFSKQEFGNRHSMALKFLLDFHDGIIKRGTEHLEAALMNIDARLRELEDNKDKPEPKMIRMANGKIKTRQVI